MLDRVLSLLVPPTCLACRRGADDVLCGPCRAALPWLRDPCPRCALPRPCAPCPARRQRFSAAVAPVAYEGPARALMHALKFQRHLAAAEVMAAQMAAVLRADDDAPLVPVPFAPARRRARGFDPADLLARRLSARTGRPVVRCLRRSGDAPHQLGAARRARLAAPSVEVHGRAPPIAVLVDDVHTTGATLDACGRALATVGTREVVAVTYARTVRRA